jgi:hypothetical protein
MKFFQFLAVVMALLISNALDGAQAPFKETTCEDFARVFANKQTAQKSTDELAALIDELFPTSHYLTSAFCTAPTELVDVITEYLEEPRSHQGDTPLMIFLDIAQHYGYSHDKISFVASALLHHGADPAARNNFGITPLHRATACTLPNVVEILLRYKDRINIDAQNSLGETPLHTLIRVASVKQSLCINNALLIIPQLITAGANPNTQIKHGETPLHTAIMMHQDQIVAALLTDPTIDITIKNGLALAPLDFALWLSTLIHNQQQTYTPAGWQSAQRTKLIPLTKIIALLKAHQVAKTNNPR